MSITYEDHVDDFSHQLLSLNCLIMVSMTTVNTGEQSITRMITDESYTEMIVLKRQW